MNAKKECLGRVVMIHGIRGENPEKHIGKLAPAFRREGFSVMLPHYGTFTMFGIGFSHFMNPRIADSIASFVTPDDILLGHSNGATLAYLISKKVHVRGCILINAALDTEVLPNADFVHIYYNAGDMVSMLSGLVPFNEWGAMGTRGYEGKRVHGILNVDCSNPPYDLPVLDGHSALFENGNHTHWSRYMAGQVKAELYHPSFVNGELHHDYS